MCVAMYFNASARGMSGITPSPSSQMNRHGFRRSRRRVMRIVEAPASRLFCTNSESAFLGSGWLRASQRISSNGS
jgi:hypothetical protein